MSTDVSILLTLLTFCIILPYNFTIGHVNVGEVIANFSKVFPLDCDISSEEGNLGVK